MSRNDKAPQGSSDRDVRLKQALKANLQRRKAQAKARATGDGSGEENKEVDERSAREAGQDG